MSELWILLGLVLAAVSWWLVWREHSKTVLQTAHRVATPIEVVSSSSGIATPYLEPAAEVVEAVPQSLATLPFKLAEALPAEDKAWFSDLLHDVPRPPRALQNMVSLDFVGKASSTELAHVIMGEPMAAAKVIAKVHSPLYGLREPVASIGQAITFIGTTSVRNVCLRYLLDESFISDNAEARKMLDELAESSTVASEMSLRLAQGLQLPDAPSLMTNVLLSFTGHLAATVLQVKLRQPLREDTSSSLLGRVSLQQLVLGLPGSEIGRLLMIQWNLPSAVVDAVAAIDRVLVTSVESAVPEQAVSLAIAYLSARLGERLVDGRLSTWDDIDRVLDNDPDFHHLKGYLALPPLRDLRKVLRGLDLPVGTKR